MSDETQNILDYYRDQLKWNPPFAEMLTRYAPEGLKGYLTTREAIRKGSLPEATRELIFAILDSLDDETSGAKAHAVAAIEAGMTMEQLTEAFLIVTAVKGINVLCKSGIEALQAAEQRFQELSEN